MLLVLALALAWTALRSAGINVPDWNVTLLVLSVLSLLALRRSDAPPLPRAQVLPLALLPAWTVLQLLPLPLALVRALSPARAALSPGVSYLSLSVHPAATLQAWTHLAGAVLIFILVRELAWRFSDRRVPWVVVLPFLIIACLEAALGLVQFYTAASPFAHGTFNSYDHYAAFLEMALPFPVMYGIASLRSRRPSRFVSPLRPALVACASFAAATLLLLTVIHSFSRMGFIASFAALGVLAASLAPRKAWLAVAPLAVVLVFIYVPPDQLITRFAALSTPDKIAAQDRLQLWRQTIPLIRAYPLTGSGLGTYESAFMPFKRKSPVLTDAYAHNDYLQYASELGLPASLLGLVLIISVLSSAATAARRHPSFSGRALALASIASLAALLLHSVVDFNTYIPADLFACAWVAAVAQSFSAAPIHPAQYFKELHT